MDRKEKGRIILLKSGSLPSYPIIVSAFYSSSLLVLDSDEGNSRASRIWTVNTLPPLSVTHFLLNDLPCPFHPLHPTNPHATIHSHLLAVARNAITRAATAR